MKARKRILRFITSELLEGAPYFGDPLATGVLDSLRLEQLIAFIEDTFNITFLEDELQPEDFADLDAVVALVSAKRKARR
jgi:hypothetical protein